MTLHLGVTNNTTQPATCIILPPAFIRHSGPRLAVCSMQNSMHVNAGSDHSGLNKESGNVEVQWQSNNCISHKCITPVVPSGTPSQSSGHRATSCCSCSCCSCCCLLRLPHLHQLYKLLVSLLYTCSILPAAYSTAEAMAVQKWHDSGTISR